MAVRVRLLGPFSVVSGGRAAGPWPRPSARRLCQLVLVSPGRRISRDLACEELFPDLDPRAAARSVSKALSMARAALAGLAGPGEPAASLLEADLTHIWASPAVEVDAAEHEQALRAALAMGPGHERDGLLAATLADDGELLADEPYADWALRPRERLEALRQEARLALARDRAKGAGDARPEAVLAAWAACAEHDPASEEAAAALVRAYFAAGQRELAVRAYERCRTALGELGLGLSPWLEEVYATAVFEAAPPRTPAPAREELRTVSVLAAEVAADGLEPGDPEDLREVTGRCLAAVIAEVEALGGTVTSVSGGGLQAMFGAPEAHEDDPERAALAAFRALSAVAAIDGGTLRIGVETGPAVLGPIGGGARVEYGAVGEVVGQAAALQALARPGSALVGPVTRAAAGHLFAWRAEVPVPGSAPATYLGPPMPRIAGHRLRPGGPLAGRQAELSALGTALREAARGHGSVVLVTGEAGLGKTRLVQECRRRAARGTRWLEGSCASYASSTPYGLYQQLLANWAGVTPDQPAAVTGPALERVLASVRGGDLFPLLARMMGLPPGAALGRMGPGELQKQTFGAWRALTSRLVAAGPAVLVLEDLHWADPTSLRLTLDLARLAAGRRLLILATGRPEAAPVLDVLDARRLTLQPLAGAAEEELARSLMGDGASREVLDAVLAREAFQAGLRAVLAGDTLRRAHLLTRLGRLEVSDNHYEAAWAAYDAAEQLLGGDPEEMDAATVEEWLELMVDGRACQYTTEHQPERALATLDAARPVIGRGSAVRKHGYYFHLAMARVARNRFRVDETDLDNARRSLAAAQEAEEKDVGYATFFLARFLLLHGDLAEAQDHLEHSLALAERIGETALRAYSLLGLAMAALRRHDIAEVRALLPRVLAEAETIAGPDYLAGAKAFLAWLAWLDRHPDDVIKLAEEIATLMTGTPDAGLYYGPVHLWPLAAVHLEAGHLAEAVAATRRLQDYTQLPASREGADLEAALTTASRAWDQNQPELAEASLTAALDLARTLGYV